MANSYECADCLHVQVVGVIDHGIGVHTDPNAVCENCGAKGQFFHAPGWQAKMLAFPLAPRQRWDESDETLSPDECAAVLSWAEADALLSVLEQAINAGIVPEKGLRPDGAESAGFKIVSERFRDADPYNRGARVIRVRYRSPNPDALAELFGPANPSDKTDSRD